MNTEDTVATGCILGVVLMWIVGVLLSLGLSAALIYLVIQIAQGEVF